MLNADILKKQELFEELDGAELEKLLPALREISLKQGDFLFREADDTKGIYLLISGNIEINNNMPHGWKQTLTVITPGQFFGELSIMENRSHRANAVALDDSALLLLPREEFERLEKEECRLALRITKKLARVMGTNLRRMNQRFLNALVSHWAGE